MSSDHPHTSTANPSLQPSSSRTDDDTVTATPNPKGQEKGVDEPVLVGEKAANEEDVEEGAMSKTSPINEADLIQGRKLAIVWSAFLL